VQRGIKEKKAGEAKQKKEILRAGGKEKLTEKTFRLKRDKRRGHAHRTVGKASNISEEEINKGN